MYPIIEFSRAEDRKDNVISWLDAQAQSSTEDRLIQSLFYYSRHDRHGIYAGAATLNVFDEQVDVIKTDLFLIVTQGEIYLTAVDGKAWRITAGESVVIARGVTFHWRNAPDTRVFFVDYFRPDAGGVEEGGDIIAVNVDAPLAPTAGPARELILSEPYPDVGRKVLYQSRDAKFSVGLWEASAYTRQLAAFGDYELMYPVAGTIAITNALGETQRFHPGEAFIVNRGVSNAWKSTGYVKKIYCKVAV